MPTKIDANLTGLSFAEESALKTLPGTPTWYELEPNSYSDFGSDISTVARAPINASRQRKKGTVTDLDASGGFNTDLTATNLLRLMQGFFFASAREKPDTQPLNGSSIAMTATTASTYTAASGLTVFKVNHLILASGFTNAANNGLAKVSTVAAGALTVTGKTLTVETPPAAAKVQAVGFEFPSADLTLQASATAISITSASVDLTTLGLNVGEWIFIGGDAATNQFATNAPGYARIKAISTNKIDFSETTFTATTDSGTGKLIRIFFGVVIRNEKNPALIVRRSYQLERQLGNDGSGTQSEYLTGAIPNEFTLNIPQADKVNADLTFVGMDNEQRTGTQGVKSGNRVSALGESALNTSSDVYRVRLNIVDPTTINNSALFAYITEGSVAINNGITGSKAVGVLGSFDASAGDFEVSGSLTAYFATVQAVQAVRNNADVAFNIIFSAGNKGQVFDIPLLSLGGGRLNVEKDQSIMIPLDTNAAENSNGYTLLYTNFQYLSDIAM